MTSPKRKRLRFADRDYVAGGYAVTTCTFRRECCLSHITQGKVVLTAAGRKVLEAWETIPRHFPGVILDEFVIMPNHIHGILFLWPEAVATTVGAGQAGYAVICKSASRATRPPAQLPTIPLIMSLFKSDAAKAVNKMNITPGKSLWQRSFFEQVLGSEEAIRNVRRHIRSNPGGWEQDTHFVP
jgi:putative transposase